MPVAATETNEVGTGGGLIHLGRVMLAALAFVGLAACDVPSIRTSGDVSALNVQSVEVDTSQMAVAVEGRAFAVTREKLDADLTAAITAALASKSDPEGRPVRVDITMEQLRLAPPIERVAAGTSAATGVVSVIEVGTGAVVVPPTRVTGNSESIRAAWILGLATTQTVDKDYGGTVNGFAATTRAALFGPDE
ncbi:hypothetical protein [uncultured Tateyamaria sp.]|uniref:hypothetical protein n=1 Tax=uncultured Tateyamaria sp. TaxID=455651 RepID=UPI002621F67F|nr:hypothetical protein [uncultured Tateyamaria sp.]